MTKIGGKIFCLEGDKEVRGSRWFGFLGHDVPEEGPGWRKGA